MDGVINLYKPADITSHRAVQKIRTILNVKKAGHAGTLDPFAEGVLLVCLDRATRISEYLTALPKEYIVEMLLGVRTDTYDITGTVVERRDYSSVKEEELHSLLKQFVGLYRQVPPIYSAKKKRGIPLYRYARKGIAVEAEPQDVFIHEIELLDFSPPLVRFKVRCSRGTYIRSLVDDLGERAGTVATVRRLKRTAVGEFTEEDSMTMEMISEGRYRLYTIDEALYFLPEYRLSERELYLAVHGTGFRIEGDIPRNIPVRLKTDGRVVAIGTVGEGNVMKINKVLLSED
ncbi:MAG TPA: tRNA pseudouridine(55) synthase TruB [Nitrospirae bacterium]|nr:tRNA pseudouridine(55) synthase TruB [Nitrospirota bacterium]